MPRCCCNGRVQITRPPLWADDLPGDVPGFRRGEEHEGPRDLFRGAQPPHRRFPGKVGLVLRREPGHHVGLDHTGGHAVDRDARRTFLFGQGAAQPDDPGLGGRVVRLAAAAHLAPHAADAQDAPVFTADHPRQHGAAGVKDAVQVGGHHPPPILVGQVGEQFLLGDARVADQHLQPPEGLFRFRCSPAGGGRVRGIGLQRQELPVGSQRPGLLQYRAGGVGMAVPGEGYVVPPPGQRPEQQLRRCRGCRR